MSARRAIWRWSWRMLRREWREQVSIAVLVVVSVAICVGGALAAFHATEPSEAIGSTVQITLSGDQAQIDGFLNDLGNYGSLDRSTAQIKGTADSIAVRAFDPTNAVLGSTIDLIDGQLPGASGEAAITAELATQLAVPLGETLAIADSDLTIVGVVENPTDLNDQFLFVDHFDPPIELHSTYITTASTGTIESIPFRGDMGVNESAPARRILTVVANIAIVLAMMLVGLLASASFGVVARRRQRQFGLLSAIGARDGQLRGAAAFNGFALGLASALVGAAIGTAIAWSIMPRLETSVGHRIDFGVPAVIVVPAVVVATLVCTIAAWMPARSLARQSIVESLAARRPRSRPARSFAGAGCVMIAVGYAGLLRSLATQFVVGAVAAIGLIVVGVLLLTPAAIALTGRVVASGSLPLRIAGRDLARFQARSAAALGAIVLSLAVPLGIGVSTASLDAGRAAEQPNLDERTAIVWAQGVDHGEGIRVPVGLDVEASLGAARRAAALDESLTAIPIEIAVDATMRAFPDEDGVPVRASHGVVSPIDCGTQVNGDTWSWGDANGEMCFLQQTSWLATPELAELWGFDLARAQRADSVITRQAGDYRALPADDEVDGPPTDNLAATVGIPNYESFPDALATLEALGPHFESMTAGWLLVSEQELTPSLIADMRAAMGDVAELETYGVPGNQRGLRTVAALIGLLVGLVILGATVILVRGEMSEGNQVLAELGATGRVRRSVSGYTAGLLAVLGATLAIPLSFVGLVVGRSIEADLPFAIPWSTMLIVFVIFPVLAAGASGALSRQPSNLGRGLVR